LTILNKNHMAFGLAPGSGTFIMFLYQMDGDLYRDNGRRSNLDDDVSIAAFKEYCRLYTDYQFERIFDFANRFRTGEMPLGLADYTLYNTFQVFAPEIKGLWGFTTVPGIMRPDGTINNTVPASAMACMIMNNSKKKEESWEFIKWWTSASVQARYGREMEALIGPSARYPTANLQALRELPWPVQDLARLEEQMRNLRGVPQVPGGYFTARHIDNAYNKVVVLAEIGAREALMDFVPIINEEIEYKFNEFGFE
ncbi:MAG: extracellular solute-binding protein, partial [Defluviitaleaceae bacterium]|nr:extracellular solute-binding protein [Defluviitaleaceae bacterium]